MCRCSLRHSSCVFQKSQRFRRLLSEASGNPVALKCFFTCFPFFLFFSSPHLLLSIMRAWVICRIIWITPQAMTKQLSRHWVQWNHRYCILDNSVLSIGISESDPTPEEFTLRSVQIKSGHQALTLHPLLDLRLLRATLMLRRENTILSSFAKL
jgi:hypothetical protein